MTVLWFAELADRMMERQTGVEIPQGATVMQMRDLLGGQFRQVADLLARCMVAVNGEYAELDRVLRPGDRVAFIPPVSGG
ncbi:MAG: molybdopterin converting factor subunit 1 [Kyrpidia sp.]|nr:molybdopterin converting factor subunit 1 [Kyrpidia sp.]